MIRGNFGAVIALALARGLGGGAAPPSNKRTEQPVNVKAMSGNHKRLYEKALRRKARWEKQG